MNELQKLCDKVPSFDSTVAMQVREGMRVKCEEQGLCVYVGGRLFVCVLEVPSFDSTLPCRV